MYFDAAAFKRCVKEKGCRLQTVAEAIGMDRTTLFRKMRGDTEFTLSEIQACYNFFGEEEAHKIFFADKVS